MLNPDKKNEKISLLHITHHKAGSQWIHKILEQCAPDRIVTPKWGKELVSKEDILDGKIFSTLYIPYDQFQHLKIYKNIKHFVVIRDLRDTLISMYFSFKISHPLIEGIKSIREELLKLNNLEDGLIFLINHWLYHCALVQFTWYYMSEPIIRYEDLLQNDLEILTPILAPCVSLSKTSIQEIIIKNRFESLTKNRQRGQEDLNSHERKALPGDWKNYFTDKVKNEFKKKYSDLIIKLGYETNNNW